MDFSKTFSISTDYREKRTPPNWELRLFAEVVIIDKTHPAAAPKLYQLQDHAIPANFDTMNARSLGSSYTKNDLVFLGDVISIDKKKKQVMLDNKNIVAYRYLIVASGSKPVLSFQDTAFSAVQTLIDAMRVKPKIPASFSTLQTKAAPSQPFSTSNHRHALHEVNESPEIGKIAHPHLSSTKVDETGVELNAINKRLYEVLI